MMKKVLVSILMIFCCFSLLAQRIQTDRPSAQTDNSSTLYKEAFQIEYGITFQFENNNLENIAIPNTLYRYGLSEKFEIRVANNLLFNNDLGRFYLDPFQFGGKYQLIKNEKSQLALLSMVSLNNLRADSISTFFQNINLKLIGSNPINDNFGLGYTIGHQFNHIQENDNFNYSIFLSIGLGDQLSGFFEVYGNLNYVETLYNQLNADFGLAYIINDKLQLDIYLGSGINNQMYFGSLGLSYLFMN